MVDFFFPFKAARTERWLVNKKADDIVFLTMWVKTQNMKRWDSFSTHENPVQTSFLDMIQVSELGRVALIHAQLFGDETALPTQSKLGIPSEGGLNITTGWSSVCEVTNFLCGAQIRSSPSSLCSWALQNTGAVVMSVIWYLKDRNLGVHEVAQQQIRILATKLANLNSNSLATCVRKRELTPTNCPLTPICMLQHAFSPTSQANKYNLNNKFKWQYWLLCAPGSEPLLCIKAIAGSADLLGN